MHLLFYISGHGFGHAARDIEVINALARLQPGLRITLRTAVPPWFLRDSLSTPLDIIAGETDTGMVQPDSLSIDEDESARRAADFYRSFPESVARERDLIGSLEATLVVGDVPPLAFAAASAAGIPSIAFGNFTWDWIYDAYPQFENIAPGVRELIASVQAGATLALRLPFPGGFASVPRITDVPLVARRASVSRAEARARLKLPDEQPLVLATFGGHGGNVPLDEAAAHRSFTLVATDYELGAQPAPRRLRVVTADALKRAGLAYTDLLAACDVVASKLGYGIVSECVANNVALLYTLRGRFAEQDVFMREMPQVLRCRYIEREQLRAGQWAPAIEGLLAQPGPPGRMDANGAEVVAATVLDCLHGR